MTKSVVGMAQNESRRIILRDASGDSLVLRCTESETKDYSAYEPSITKGVPITTANLGENYNNGELYITSYQEDGSLFIVPQKLVYQNSASGMTFWKTEKGYAWPDSYCMAFWSWAPNGTGEASIAPTINNSDSTMTFSYTMPGHVEGKDAENQPDIVVAHTYGTRSGNYVSLHLEHALSALRFEVDNTVACKVKNITLGGVYSTGLCTYKPDIAKAHAYEQIEWSDLDDEVEYTQDFDQSINAAVVEGIAPGQPIGPEEATFMIIPQCATGGNEVFFSLVYEINGVEKLFTATLKDQDWKAGVTYTYGIDNAYVEIDVDDNVEGNIKKDVRITSTKNSVVKCYIRAMIIGNWFKNIGTESEPELAIIAPWSVGDGVFDPLLPENAGDNVSNWILGADGFYYYMYPVYPNTETGTDADGEGDPDRLFTTYTAPESLPIEGSYLSLNIVAQGVMWDKDKSAVTNAWGETAAGYLSPDDKPSN